VAAFFYPVDQEDALTDYDAIVVGSGAGGLAAALRMAQLKLSVLILEAMPAFGGYINPFERHGYHFDTGVHYLGKLGENGSFRLLLELLGIADDIHFVELNPDGFDHYVFPDFELRLCKDKAQYHERLLKLFPHESNALKQYFQLLDRLLAAFSDPHGPPKNLWDRLRYAIRHPVLMKYHRATYQQILDNITTNPRLQAALSAHCGNAGLPPERASGFLCLMLLDHYLEGAYYPQGGSAALRDAMVNAAAKNGVVMKNHTPVTRIHRSGSEFIVGSRSGETFSAKTIVCNVDPSIAFQQLIDPNIIPRSTRKKAARLQPSGGAFYAFIGTRLDLSDLGVTDANLIHYEYTDVNRTFAAVVQRPMLAPFPYFFVTSPSLKDPGNRYAPDSTFSLEILSGLGHDHVFTPWSDMTSRRRGEDYEQLKHQVGMSLVRSAERYIPDLSNHLDFIEFATPLSNAYWVNSLQGGNFGPEQTPAQFGPGRFFDCKSGIEGLFVVGAGAISAGVQSCIASGVWAANQAAEAFE
jgi:phytoene dehydrogenase-like protein